MPAVSIIVPVYDVEQYIARCAASLFGQTLEDIEYIFIDDCTPDASMDVVIRVLEDYPARKPQVRCFRMPANSGQAAVRMKGLEMATGEYIAWCDSDDEIGLHSYRKLYEKAAAENLDIVTGNMLKEEAPGRWRTIRGEYNVVGDILRGAAPCNLVCRIIRRALFDGVVPPAGNMGEDMMLTIQATLRAGSKGHLDEAFYKYYYRESSTSKVSGADSGIARTRALEANMRLLLELLSSKYGYSGNEPEIIAFKYYGRHCIEPYVGEKRCYDIWRSLWPEIDKVLLATPGIPLEKKFWFILIHIRLYPAVKRITGKLLR
jgi:glycosyltransferase involved in cell wall biosynthesis